MKIFVLLFLSIFSFAANAAKFERVVYVIFENTNYKDAIAVPEFAEYAKRGLLFTNFFGETHPSQPNYIAMISGSTLGVNTNNNVDLTENHLGDLLENKGFDWRVYAEDYPGNCFLGKTYGHYARKHTPFLSFKNVSTNSERCNKVQNLNQFFSDWKNKTLPSFSMIIPNNESNGHDTGVEGAGVWLKSTFERFVTDSETLEKTLFVITFDEGSRLGKNQIYTAILGASIAPGTRNTQKLNHYNLLKMIEDEWQLGDLGRGDKQAQPIIL